MKTATRELPELLTVAEAAEALRCGKTTVYALINAGRLSYVQASSRRRRITKAAILAYIDGMTRGGDQMPVAPATA